MYVKHFLNVDFLLYFRNSSRKPSDTSEQVNKIYPNVIQKPQFASAAADGDLCYRKAHMSLLIDVCVYPDRFQGKGTHQIPDLQVRRLSL